MSKAQAILHPLRKSEVSGAGWGHVGTVRRRTLPMDFSKDQNYTRSITTIVASTIQEIRVALPDHRNHPETGLTEAVLQGPKRPIVIERAQL